MRRFKISKVKDPKKVVNAIKNVFGLNNENDFAYNIKSQDAHCIVDNETYLIKDFPDMQDLKKELKKKIEEKIKKTIEKLKAEDMVSVDVDEMIDDKKLSDLLRNKDFLGKIGILYDENTDLYFVKTNKTFEEEKEETGKPEEKNNEVTENIDDKNFEVLFSTDSGFSWIKNKDGFVALISPNKKYILGFDKKIENIHIDEKREIVVLEKDKKINLYSYFGKKINKNEYSDLYGMGIIGEDKNSDLMVFRDGDFWGIVEKNGNELISKDKKIETPEVLKEEYLKLTGQENQENEPAQTHSEIKIKNNLLSGSPEEVKKRITQILQKNGVNVIISKRKRR